MSKGPTSMNLPPRQPVKGEASASVRSIEAPMDVAASPSTPSHQAELTTSTLPPNVKALGGMVAVTVRMDRETYEQLKFHGVRTRQTNQDILLNLIKSMLKTQV